MLATRIKTVVLLCLLASTSRIFCCLAVCWLLSHISQQDFPYMNCLNDSSTCAAAPDYSSLLLPCSLSQLSRVEVNLEKAFEPGMAYVALSRARSLDGLRILGSSISAQALRADPRVVAFYARMRSTQGQAQALRAAMP